MKYLSILTLLLSPAFAFANVASISTSASQYRAGSQVVFQVNVNRAGLPQGDEIILSANGNSGPIPLFNSGSGVYVSAPQNLAVIGKYIFNLQVFHRNGSLAANDMNKIKTLQEDISRLEISLKEATNDGQRQAILSAIQGDQADWRGLASELAGLLQFVEQDTSTVIITP